MKYIKAYEYSDDELFADEMPHWYQDCPFGNLELKYGFVLTKLNLLNETVQEIIKLDEERRRSEYNREAVTREISLRPIALKMRFSLELKIYTDELISIYYLLVERKKTNLWPEKIKVDCVAALLKSINKPDYKHFKVFQNTFNTLNGLANAVKHSFINTEVLWYKTHEPESMLIGFYHKYNNLKKIELETFETSLLEFIDKYNEFLFNIKKELKNNHYSELV